RGAVRLRLGDAADTGQQDDSADVAISVNSYMLWPDPPAGLAELRRVLRSDGRLLFSVHERWLPGGRDDLAAAVGDAGFVDVVTELWEPPGRAAATAVQLRARCAD
ncbi:MAG: class I SAM-dependent methyltransferase, partial [Nocardioidaceae bacterium]